MKVEELIGHLLAVESEVYPPQYCSMNGDGVRSWDDLAAHCEGDPYVRVWDRGYLLWTQEEIVDFASVTPLSLGQLMAHLGCVAATCPGPISAFCRQKTSWRLLEAAERRGFVELSIGDVEWCRGEAFYDVTLTFTDRARRLSLTGA